MKKNKIFSIFTFLFIVFSFISCDNEPIDPTLLQQINSNNGNNGGGGNGGNPTNGIFKVDFGGQTWEANDTEAIMYSSAIQIGGLKTSNGQTFAFALNGNTVGTYDSTSNLIAYDANNNSNGDVYWAVNPTNPSVSAGTVTITNIDTVNKKISGTFSFTGYWSDTSVSNVPPISFTNGVFTNIPYTAGTNTSTDLFYAKVDGTEFVEDQIDVSEVIASGFPDSYSIVGAKADGQNVGLRISKALGVGTYNFSGPFNQNLTSTCVFNSLLYTSDTGALTISEKTATRMKGTFSLTVSNFTTSQTKTITQGSFDVELP
ncbi:DUF6252 family protein [Flavobacterium chungnamense]|uniref:DUF4465 domain-containing protein n=1 Tax=Flavobacterium chungnamense TaxID=706182 RepID=A0ABP7UW84_9FLAO